MIDWSQGGVGGGARGFFFNFDSMQLNVVGFDDAVNLTEQWGCLRYMGVSKKMVGFPNNHGVFLLRMIILGCFGGTTI